MGGIFMAGNDILSRIQVLLDADTANFSAGMQKAKGESKSTFESIRENANKMGTAVAAGAGTALVALIAFMTTPGKGAVGAIDCSEEQRKKLAKEYVYYFDFVY